MSVVILLYEEEDSEEEAHAFPGMNGSFDLVLEGGLPSTPVVEIFAINLERDTTIASMILHPHELMDNINNKSVIRVFGVVGPKVGKSMGYE